MNIAIFYSIGAFGDCARHAIFTAIENNAVEKVKIFSKTLETLEEPNWKSGCPGDLGEKLRTSPYAHKIEKINVDVTDEEQVSKIDMKDIDAVIAGLGNRQIFLGERVANTGIKNIISRMKDEGIDRLVMMSSFGIKSKVSNDKPGMEWRVEGKIMGAIFKTLSRREYKDIKRAENEVFYSGLNYVICRPMGLGEGVPPVGKYWVQKKKFDYVLGPNVAKMDIGRFLANEAIEPTYEKVAVAVGGDPEDAYKSMSA